MTQSAEGAGTVHRLAGLKNPVDIAVDRWGLAHIRAENAHDLFFAQGFNAARDRLWQIDLWRKRGLGLLAADFGPGYLAQDEASRLFLYRGDMDREWAAYAPDAQEVCEAFTAGINAYVAEIEAGLAALPAEFQTLGTRPSRWNAEDVVRIRSHCLTRNALSEIVRANVLAAGGERAERLRRKIEPASSMNAAIDPSSVPLEVAEAFKLATADVSFSPERLAARLDEAPRWRKLDSTGDVVAVAESQGSNNWAVHPSRTATGRAIMATDPHRTFTIPSLRYLVHLEMPGFSAIGAGEPVMPGVALGHNERVAFSLTIFGADQEDVYAYELDGQDERRYRYGDDFEQMVEVEELFEVKGAPPQTRVLRFTRHGPVIYQDPANHRAFALRTVWSEPGSAPYMASLSVMRAQEFDSYRKALESWGAPSINHVYADVDGNIGWQTVGKTPVRNNWDGLLPVPGDGRFEWQGFFELDQLPHSFNPQCGFIATANEMNIPEGWALPAAIGHEWADKSRSQRIHTVLEGQPEHALDDSCRLQNDVRSVAAQRFQAVLGKMTFTDGEARSARDHLLAWDCFARAGSSPAALHEVWVGRHLAPSLYEAAGAGELVAALLQPGDVQAILDVIEMPQGFFDVDADLRLRHLLETTLAAAWRECTDALDANPENWRWGTLHRLALLHAVDGAFDEAKLGFSPAYRELGGTGSTPMLAAYRLDDFVAIAGPSVRMVMDVGDWDRSLFVNMPGQSGDPASAHYTDLLDDWREGRYHQLAFSRPAVDAVTATLIKLVPG